MDERPSHARPPSLGGVKNKAPATVQITAEQLLREAWERKEQGPTSLPKQRIADHEELQEYQRTERQQFEMRIVRNRSHTPLWIRYARWEETQEEFARARSIWERAIDNDYRSPAIWLNYAEMEMRHKFINHARNVFDRAVALLPRVDQVWLKYIHMEEMLGKADLARLIYHRWLKWFPDNSAYFAFIRFELRNGNIQNARAVYNELVRAHPTAHSYIKFAKFEERQEEFAKARGVYERASEELLPEYMTVGFFILFAKFEERRKQPARARAIYKFAMEKVPKADVADLQRAYGQFEKQQGDNGSLDELLYAKKRAKLEEVLSANAHDYDTWVDLLRLEEAAGDEERVRETYRRAVATPPVLSTKRGWSKYIYLWVGWALWEELDAGDMERAADVYAKCIASVPNNHRVFSFGKLWLLAAKLEVRRGDVGAARRILGRGLGVMPTKHALYRGYIEMEIALAETERARKLFQFWLERNPTASAVYVQFAQMEAELMEFERARRLLEIGVEMQGIDRADAVWECYIELERGLGESERALKLYERYVSAVGGLAVWRAYATYAESLGEKEARATYREAQRALKERMLDAPGEAGRRAELAELLEAWLGWERRVGGDEVRVVEGIQPRRIRRKRAVVDAQGVEGGWEEYVEFVFPEEVVKKPQLKILEAARKWKMIQDSGAG